MEVRCAVIGLGRQGYRHAVNLANYVPGAKLMAVCDAIPEYTEQVARELGVAHWSTSPFEVLDRDDVDAVVVATPTNTHALLLQEVARRGKALFVEKPLSLDLGEAANAVRSVEASGIICQVGFMRRFSPDYAYMEQHIRKGTIGQPLYFKAVSRDAEAPTATYVASSGGIFADQSIHDYDIARFLMNDEVTEVTAVGSVLYSKYVADYGDVDQAITYLRFQGGGAGDIEACRNAFYGYDIRGEVIGTEGTLALAGLRANQVALLRPGSEKFDTVPGFLERFSEAYVLELQHFIDSVRNQTPPRVGVMDGYRALAIAQAARSSYESGGSFPVPELTPIAATSVACRRTGGE